MKVIHNFFGDHEPAVHSSENYLSSSFDDGDGYRLFFPENAVGSEEINPSPYCRKNIYTNLTTKNNFDQFHNNSSNETATNHFSWVLKKHISLILLKTIRLEYYPISLQYGIKTPQKIFNKYNLNGVHYQYGFLLPLVETDSFLHYDGEVFELQKDTLFILDSNKQFEFEYGATKMTFMFTGTFTSDEVL